MPSNKTKKISQRTVKAFETDIALINKHAKKMGCTAADVIHVMCEDMRRKQYLQELGESFDSVRSNKNLYAELQAEQKAWDATISDGINDAT